MGTGRDGRWLPPLPVIIAGGWVVISCVVVAVARALSSGTP